MDRGGDLFVMLADLAEQHRSAGRFADADEVLRQAIAGAEHELGPGHPMTTQLRAGLTRLLIDLGRDAEAAELENGRWRRDRRGGSTETTTLDRPDKGG